PRRTWWSRARPAPRRRRVVEHRRADGMRRPPFRRSNHPFGSASGPKRLITWSDAADASSERHVSLPTISPLRGLVEVARLLRAREDLPALLDAVARTIGESLGYRTVAVNLYRPEWDDFEVTTVHGNEEAKAVLLGNSRPGDDWTVLLSDRFERRGADVVPRGAGGWESLGPGYVPQGGRGGPPHARGPGDAAFVPVRDQRGPVLRVLSGDGA